MNSGTFEQSGEVDALVPRSGVLAMLSVRCVECEALYPGFEDAPRYRCECGGVLDVEMPFRLPSSYRSLSAASSVRDEDEIFPSSGAAWRQLFDGRACAAPIWPLDTTNLLADRSGVWRYRELILPVPEDMLVSRPEGNTGLYPVGLENCATSRAGHRQIGLFAGLEHFF